MELDLEEPLLQSQDSVAIDIRQDGDKRIKTLKFEIKGMECASCATSIESLLNKLDGIQSVVVSVMNGQAVVKYVPGVIDGKTIKGTIEDAGFKVEGSPEQDIAVCRLKIKGMACTSCAEAVERALSAANGVKRAVVGLALEVAKVNFYPNITDPKQIIEAVEDCGFEAVFLSAGDDVNKVHLKLDGVHSLEDAKIVKSALELAVGVNYVEMDIEDSKVIVSYDPELTGPRSPIDCQRGFCCSNIF